MSCPQYVSIVEHGSRKMVGILEGLYGTCTLLVALPFGTLADRWRRDRVLRICGVLEIGARLHSVLWAGADQASSAAALPRMPCQAQLQLPADRCLLKSHASQNSVQAQSTQLEGLRHVCCHAAIICSAK